MEISRSDLQRQLRRAALVRGIVTLAVVPIVLILMPLLPASIFQSGWVLVAFFGPPLLISAIVTQTMCRSMVRCPRGGQGLALSQRGSREESGPERGDQVVPRLRESTMMS